MLSLFRQLTYQKLSSIKLEGRVLDLGGVKDAEYHKLFSGNFEIKTVNIDIKSQADFNFNLEKNLPLEDSSYNNVICLNVLEHIFNYQNLVNEAYRVLKSGGQMINVTPFLLNVHPSPNDYFRYTKQALEKIFETAGFGEIKIEEIGTGVFGATYQLKFGFYKINIIRRLAMLYHLSLDRVLKLLRPNSFITERHMPLGYIVIAQKP